MLRKVFEELQSVNSSSSPFFMLFFVVYAGIVEGKLSQNKFTHFRKVAK